MVVVVASDALLDSPGRLFWPIILVESGRVEAHAAMPTPVLLQHPSTLHAAVSYL